MHFSCCLLFYTSPPSDSRWLLLCKWRIPCKSPVHEWETRVGFNEKTGDFSFLLLLRLDEFCSFFPEYLFLLLLFLLLLLWWKIDHKQARCFFVSSYPEREEERRRLYFEWHFLSPLFLWRNYTLFFTQFHLLLIQSRDFETIFVVSNLRYSKVQ